ncbi:MAG: DAK2 domain-containing protein, partial [Mycetocola sp.]
DGRTRVAPIVNGLGTTKYEELFLLWRHIARRLRDAGYELIEPEVGELVTSLDMGGASLTLQWLDEELERLWRADAYTPAYRKQRAPLEALDQDAVLGAVADGSDDGTAPPASAAAQALTVRVVAAITALHTVIAENEDALGRIDAVAGDGDHGRGMLKGADAALSVAGALPEGAGVAWALGRIGRSWAANAGGTSGVLWGAALEAFGASLGDTADGYTAADVAAALTAFIESIGDLGRAELGDKTLLDAAIPFAETFRAAVDRGEGTAVAWRVAAVRAVDEAAATAQLRPRVGRARPLAEKSVGTPDAGATSFGLIVTAVADTLDA